jgi:hypothetical protein
LSSSSPALSDLQTQLHDIQSSLANHVENVRALEGVIAENDAIRREVGLLRQLVEKSGTARDGEREEEDFGSVAGVGGGGSDDDDARSICTIILHELERVEEEDGEQMARQK